MYFFLVPVMIFAPTLTAFFNAKPEVVEYGTLFLRWITPAYVLCCVNQIYSGVLRGAGYTRATAVITFITVLLVRPGIALLMISESCFVVSIGLSDLALHIAAAILGANLSSP